MPSHTLRSLRVLIVDDDPLIRTTFAEQLDSQRAITVVAAASGGRQAISLLMTGQQPIDVVLLDSDMPDMDGAPAPGGETNSVHFGSLATFMGLLRPLFRGFTATPYG